MPEEIHVASDGLSLTFTDPLDPDSATDVGNYGIKHWNYDYAVTNNFGIVLVQNRTGEISAKTVRGP